MTTKTAARKPPIKRLTLKMHEDLDRMCLKYDVRTACNVTGTARERRFAKVVERLTAQRPASRRRLTAYAHERLAAEERSEANYARLRMQGDLISGHRHGPLTPADLRVKEVRDAEAADSAWIWTRRQDRAAALALVAAA
jgi:hypothetical protein